MASPRALSLTSRWQGLTFGMASRAFRASVTRLNSTKAQEQLGAKDCIRVTAYERALKDVYGDEWKQSFYAWAEHKQKDYVKRKEKFRKKLIMAEEARTGSQITRFARDDEYNDEWHKKVERLKAKILQEKQAREEASGGGLSTGTLGPSQGRGTRRVLLSKHDH